MGDLLTLIAELSVGIAGFTAVFSVLDRGGVRDPAEAPLQLFRVKQMLLGGVTTALACVLALALMASSLSEPVVWRIAGGAGAAAILTLFVTLQAEAKRERLSEAPGYSHAHASVIYGLAATGLVFLGLTVIAAAQPIAPTLYSGGMVAMFALSAIQFARAAIKQFAASMARAGRE